MTARRATTTAALDRAVRRADRDADWQQYEAGNKAANAEYARFPIAFDGRHPHRPSRAKSALLGVACPACGAEDDQPCQTEGGNRSHAHQVRLLAANQTTGK